MTEPRFKLEMAYSKQVFKAGVTLALALGYAQLYSQRQERGLWGQLWERVEKERGHPETPMSMDLP